MSNVGRLGAAVFAAGVVLAGCGDATEEDVDPAPAAQEEQAEVEEPAEEAEPATEQVDEPAEDEEPAEASGGQAVEGKQGVYDIGLEPQAIETGPFTVNLNNLTYVSWDDAASELRTLFEDNPFETLIGLEHDITNNSDDDVTLYLSWSNLVINGEQMSADIFFSDGDGNFLAGVAKEGMTIFPSQQTAGEIQAVGEARFVTEDGPVVTETFESLGDRIDVILNW